MFLNYVVNATADLPATLPFLAVPLFYNGCLPPGHGEFYRHEQFLLRPQRWADPPEHKSL